jgi:hypothetical protein
MVKCGGFVARLLGICKQRHREISSLLEGTTVDFAQECLGVADRRAQGQRLRVHCEISSSPSGSLNCPSSKSAELARDGQAITGAAMKAQAEVDSA